MKNSTNLKYVFYGRVSTVEQNNGIQAQYEECNHFAKSNKSKIVARFEEKASGKIEDRTELLKAIEYAKQNNAVLLVSKLDRLSRKNSHLCRLWEQFREEGIQFEVASTPNIANNILYFSVLSGMAEQESIYISERTKEGMAIAKKNGHVAGRKKGCDLTPAITKSIKNRKEKSDEWIKNYYNIVLTMRKANITLQGIADALNKDGKRTNRGTLFTPNTIFRILKKCECNNKE